MATHRRSGLHVPQADSGSGGAALLRGCLSNRCGGKTSPPGTAAQTAPSAHDPRCDSRARSMRPALAEAHHWASCGLDGKRSLYGVPAKVRQQAAEPVLRAMQVDVVTKTRLQTHAGHARLLRINLPRMQVEDRRFAVEPIDACDGPARDAVWRQ